MPALSALALLAAWEQGGSEPPIQRALTLLTTAWPDRSADDWAHASIGERDESLLRLREELFGSELETTAACPECAERLELTFGIDDIRASSPESCSADGQLHVEARGYELNCRLPNSLDLLEIARDSNGDGYQALLNRCVEAARQGGAIVDVAALPNEVLQEVAEQLGRADPQAEVQLALACPACSHQWSMAFDILSYLWSEVDDWAQRLLLEVHLLATAYGWSEADIMSMSARRRQVYLEMIGA